MCTSKVIFCYYGREGVITDDNELIYMRARYYSLEMKRFINAYILAGEISNAVVLETFNETMQEASKPIVTVVAIVGIILLIIPGPQPF